MRSTKEIREKFAKIFRKNRICKMCLRDRCDYSTTGCPSYVDSLLLNEDGGDVSTEDRIIDHFISIIESERAGLSEKYDDIFKWLLGENGDFPDLSRPPHYAFRKELRKRLDNLTSDSR